MADRERPWVRYVGRAAAATSAAGAEARARAVAATWPPCQVCGRPMAAGQEHSNAGAHFACRGPLATRIA